MLTRTRWRYTTPSLTASAEIDICPQPQRARLPAAVLPPSPKQSGKHRLKKELSNLELETATHVVFGTEENPLPRPASQHLWDMLRGTGVGTLDAHGVPRPYTKEKFLEIYSHQRDSTKKLTVAQEEELALHEAEELRQQSLAESRDTFAWS
ncbi:unnamed protein product [Closterium sp. NIES-54]